MASSMKLNFLGRYRGEIIEFFIPYLIVSIRSIQILQKNGLDRNYDRALYHDYVSEASNENWLSRDWLAAGLSTWSTPTGQYLDLLANSILSPTAAMYALTMLVNLLNASSLYFLASHFVKTDAKISLPRISSVTLPLIGTLYLAEVGSSFTNWSSLFLYIFSLHYLLKFSKELKRNNLILSGFFIGLAISFKFTNTLLVIGLFTSLIVIVQFCLRREYLRSYLTFAGSTALGTFPNWIHWFKTWDLTGNPVFPFYNALFRSKYYPEINFRDNRWKFDSLGDLWSFFGGLWGPPWNLELNAFDPRVPIFMFCLIWFIFLSKKRHLFTVKSPHFHLVLQIVVGSTLWAINLNYGRYFIPLEALMGFAIPILSAQILALTVQRVFLNVIILISLVFNFVPQWSLASSKAEDNQVGKRWDSEFIVQVEKIKGTVLISGEPNSFVALYNRELESIIRIDFGELPMTFKKRLIENLDSGDALTWIHTSSRSSASVELLYSMQPFIGDLKIEVSCRTFEAPIYAFYEICVVSKFS